MSLRRLTLTQWRMWSLNKWKVEYLPAALQDRRRLDGSVRKTVDKWEIPEHFYFPEQHFYYSKSVFWEYSVGFHAVGSEIEGK